jgi:ankyrin repeat protein/TPR repeat protein
MLAQLKWLIDLLRASTGPIDPEGLKVSMTSLHYEWEQLERIFGHAQGAANEATLITDEDERTLFDNWLNHQQRYIDAGRNALHTILGFDYDQKDTTQAELRMVSDNLKKLLKASKFKYHEIIDSSGFSDRAGRSLIESYLNQLIDVLEAPRQRTSPVILDDVDEPFSAARAGIQSNIDRKLSELVGKGRRSYSCFLSYAWGNATHEAIVAHVAKLLGTVGITVHFDRWTDVPGKRIQDFVAKIDSSDWVVIFGSQLYQQKYKRRAMSMSDQEHVVRAEAQIMNKIAMSSTKRAQTVVPVLLEGTNQTALPQPFSNDHIAIDLSEGDYVTHVIRLIKTLYKLPLDDVSLSKKIAATTGIASSSSAASSSAVASSSSAASSGSVSDVMEYSARVGMFGEGAKKPRTARRPLLSSTEGGITDLTLWNVPDVNSNYQERLSYNQKIEAALSGEGQGVISQTIAGSGGIGKTQLALNYAYQNRGNYAFVRFVLAETRVGQVESASGQAQSDLPYGLEQQYCDFARALGVDTQNSLTIIREDVKQRLARCLSGGKRALVIFDNVDSKAALDPFLADLKSFETLDVLITTRDVSGVWGNSIRVDVYEPFQAVSYVCRALVKEEQFDLMDAALKDFCQEHQAAILNDALDWSAILASGSEVRLKLVCDFVNALDCYPIALTHALAYCVEDEMELSAYLQEFQGCMSEVIPGQEEYEQNELGGNNYFSQEILGDKYGKTIYITFKFIFDKLLQDCREESGIAKQIALATLRTLGCLAYLSPDAIPKQLLESVIRAQLIAADERAGRPRVRTVKQVFEQLMRFGILHGSKEANEYYTHRLIQSVVQFFWKEVLPNKKLDYLPDQRGLVMLLVDCINADFPGISQVDGNFHSKALISYTAHLEILQNACLSFEMAGMFETVLLQSNLGFLYHLSGEEKKARLSQESALSALERVEGSDKISLADKLVVRRARALMGLNQYRLAKEALTAQFPSIKERGGVSLLAQDCFVDLLCRMHNRREARRLIVFFLKNMTNRAQSSNASISEDESYVQARLYYQLATLSHRFGENEKALEYVSKAIEDTAGDNELLLADCYLLLAKVNTALKAYADAIISGDKAMVYAEAFYGAEHIQVGRYLVDYARLLIETPDRDARFRIVKRAKNLLERLSQKGDAKAAYHLAWAYDNGVFVEYKEVLAKSFAFKFYEDAAASGDHAAQLQLAKVYLSGKGEVKRLTRYVREDKAYQLLAQAAETDFHAEYELAQMISKQLGLARDMGAAERTALAYKHYLSAAKSGLSEAEFSLGCCYLNGSVPLGLSPEQCDVKAMKWIMRAAEQKHGDAKKLLLLLQKNVVSLVFSKTDVLSFTARINYPAGVGMLIEGGVVPNGKRLGSGFTALHIAAVERNFLSFKALIEAGADINVASNSGRTVLHHAAQGGHPGIIRHLHHHGININQPARDGRRAINIAALSGHYAAFEALLEAGADINVASKSGRTVLHHAAQGGHPDIIRHLHQQGININQPALDGRRAINIAALSGHYAAFSALLEAGADINVTSNNGMTVLHHAAQGGHPDIIRHLHHHGININQPARDGRRAINIVARSGHYAAFEALLEAGADINVVDNLGFTVLHHAAQGGHPDIIRHLHQQGININQPGLDGRRAINIAALSGHYAAFSALLEAGADINVVDHDGRTVLHHAADGGHPDIIRHFHHQGININQPALDGMRAIHLAALSGHFTAFSALLEAGADTNVTSNSGWTVLHYAADGGHPDIIRHFHHQGININQPALDGRRAIHQAVLRGHFTAFSALLEAGADTNVASNSGWTVLHYAAQGGHPDIIRHFHHQGININQPALDGRRAIHQGALRGHFAAFEALLEAGADFNVADHDGRTVLHLAAQGGHPDIIRHLHRQGININQPALDGRRAIHQAALSGHYAAFEALIEAGADINVADHDGRTVLHHAADGGHPDIIRHLHRQGININQPLLHGRRAIHIAAMGGHFTAFSALLGVGADINVASNSGRTVLHHAAQGGHPDIIRHLHHQGININQPDLYGMRAIHQAAVSGHITAFEALLEAGADINVVDNLGFTVLHHAAQGGHPDIIRHLHQQGININQPALDGIRAIHQAALSGQLAVFSALLEAGADINVADHDGRTVLHHAADGGHPDMIRHFHHQGININQPALDGMRAIHLAALSGHFTAFSALLEAGADINVASNSGFTVLHYAAQGGHPDMIRHLHHQGIPINQPALDGRRAIHQGALRGHFAAFEALLEAGADFNVADHEGWTVLHLAAQGGHPDIIRHLHRQGININQPALDGRRAINLAALSGHFAAFEALIEAGADFNVADHNGWTVLHHAAQGGHPDTIRHLHRQGININQPALDGSRAINIAAMCGHFSAFEALMELGAVFNVADNNGRTVLHYAAQGGHPDIIRHLHHQGIPINKPALDGTRAIHIAALAGQFAALEALLEAGAGIYVVSYSGCTVLHHAAQGGQPDIIQFLIKKGLSVSKKDKSGRRPIHIAAATGQVKAFVTLLEQGASIDQCVLMLAKKHPAILRVVRLLSSEQAEQTNPAAATSSSTNETSLDDSPQTSSFSASAK